MQATLQQPQRQPGDGSRQPYSLGSAKQRKQETAAAQAAAAERDTAGGGPREAKLMTFLNL